MKQKILLTTCLLTLGLINSNYAGEMMTNSKKIKKATFIKLLSKPEAQSQLEQFLQKGALLVRQTEPGTPLWFGLKDGNSLAIFDVFFDDKGKEQHFLGQVAHALKENANALVQGGWEKGVLQNVNHFDIIAANHFSTAQVLKTKEVSFIIFKAKPSKSQAVEAFLKEAALLVSETEPSTYFWLALKANEDTYVVFDAFPSQSAQKAHFSGQVAAKLQNSAGELIVDGWENGVLANVHNFEVIAVS
ncbi:Uncharacterised protein [Legionella beliardensis]|uniref:Antibiotic biosynthesis monooxygenase n=1 Tax=Legionella beliardensis TaxID=91822 RepID=A0A378JQB7_9GAMM|nr:hypothetical protein [Legionella beliardensis]STX55797.1 Uncharacterised protein [Legionella beliardensis]